MPVLNRAPFHLFITNCRLRQEYLVYKKPIILFIGVICLFFELLYFLFEVKINYLGKSKASDDDSDSAISNSTLKLSNSTETDDTYTD